MSGGTEVAAFAVLVSGRRLANKVSQVGLANGGRARSFNGRERALLSFSRRTRRAIIIPRLLGLYGPCIDTVAVLRGLISMHDAGPNEMNH